MKKHGWEWSDRYLSGLSVLNLTVSLVGLSLVSGAVPLNAYPQSTPPVYQAQVPAVNGFPTLTEAERPPSAFVNLMGDRVTVRLVNQTGADIAYDVIGDTGFRRLAGNSEITLTNLSVPMTLTFRREDGGLLQVYLQANTQPGLLVVNLSATRDFGDDRTSVNVNQAGAVFLF